MTIHYEPAQGFENHDLRTRAVETIVIHRIEVSLEDASFRDTPKEIARFFREHPIGQRATGGRMPYPLLIDANGEVTQTIPLVRISPHARAFNQTGIGVGCIGDFRSRPPNPEQYQRLVALCALLCQRLALPVEALTAHDCLAGGSLDVDKECPGRMLSIAVLRRDVASASPMDARLLWEHPDVEL